jgi:hypothetical protein
LFSIAFAPVPNLLEIFTHVSAERLNKTITTNQNTSVIRKEKKHKPVIRIDLSEANTVQGMHVRDRPTIYNTVHIDTYW